MAISYYDDAITQKIKGWLADHSTLRVLSPDESTRLIQLHAEDSNDEPLQLPLIAISRNKDIELLSAIKQSKSFDGFVLQKNEVQAVHLNVIPIKTTYQLDIYTKKRIEADEYVRQYLFKLINNPQIVVTIPYNNFIIQHNANLRVLDTISDTSDISTHIFPGQFYKWTIQLELQDGFLFSIPVKAVTSLGEVSFKPSDTLQDSTQANKPNSDSSNTIAPGDSTPEQSTPSTAPDAGGSGGSGLIIDGQDSNYDWEPI